MWKTIIKKESETPTTWIFSVVVTAKEGKTFSYIVTAEKEHYQSLTQEKISPVTLVERTFFFLAEKEPFSAILHEFNLRDVMRYFPEYEDHIKTSIA